MSKELQVLEDFVAAVRLRIIKNKETFADAVGNVTYLAAGHTEVGSVTHEEWNASLPAQKLNSKIQL